MPSERECSPNPQQSVLCVQKMRKIALTCSSSACLREWNGPARGPQESMSHQKTPSGDLQGDTYTRKAEDGKLSPMLWRVAAV